MFLGLLPLESRTVPISQIGNGRNSSPFSALSQSVCVICRGPGSGKQRFTQVGYGGGSLGRWLLQAPIERTRLHANPSPITLRGGGQSSVLGSSFVSRSIPKLVLVPA